MSTYNGRIISREKHSDKNRRAGLSRLETDGPYLQVNSYMHHFVNNRDR